MCATVKDLQELDFKKTHVIQLDEQAHPAFTRLKGLNAPKVPSVYVWLAEHGDQSDPPCFRVCRGRRHRSGPKMLVQKSESGDPHIRPHSSLGYRRATSESIVPMDH